MKTGRIRKIERIEGKNLKSSSRRARDGFLLVLIFVFGSRSLSRQQSLSSFPRHSLLVSHRSENHAQLPKTCRFSLHTRLSRLDSIDNFSLRKNCLDWVLGIFRYIFNGLGPNFCYLPIFVDRVGSEYGSDIMNRILNLPSI